MNARYHIGIDLGTTNSALAFIDTESDLPGTQTLLIEQVEAPFRSHRRATLPSALYLIPAAERDGRYDIPAQQDTRTTFAGTAAVESTLSGGSRTIQSAKSWLCNPEVDRSARILPWGAEVEHEEKLSPIEVSAQFLRHLKNAWNSQFPQPFGEQDVCITVPASFDEVSQRLTLEASAQAGYPTNVRLLEEPQAAFYYWLQHHRTVTELSELQNSLNRELRILVIDIGGGTSDFTLFEMRSGPGGSKLVEIARVAVSDHLLLGGDNMDLALARHLETRLNGSERLPRSAWGQLLMQCRSVKERALSAELSEHEWHVAVTGSGSSIFAAARSAPIQRSELETLLLEGFFPLVDQEARPKTKSAGLRELGLPYAADSAVTRHLAAFLQGRQVDALLCNGGALKPAFLQQRLLDQLAHWQPARPILLSNDDMDLAVAHGAAWYGYSRTRSEGLIRAGYPHTLYLKVAEAGKKSCKLMCLLAEGTEPGTVTKISGLKFNLLVNQPATFELSRTTQTRAAANEKAGDFAELQNIELYRLPPMQARLETDNRRVREIEVSLESELTETGLLRLFCVSTADTTKRWELQFNLRKQTSENSEPDSADADLGSSPESIRAALAKIERYYGKAVSKEMTDNPKKLVRELEALLGKPKLEWNLPLSRMLWTALASGITKRSRSLAHETAWLSLTGFVLRPGYGEQLDRFRIAELWRAFELGLYAKKEPSAYNEWCILWRRVGGGLDAAQQQLVFDSLAPELEAGRGFSAELPRLLGSLERLDIGRKERLAKVLLRRSGSMDALRTPLLLALGRLGNRVPLYAGADAVVPPHWVEKWFEILSPHDWRTSEWHACCTVFSQACRKTPLRELEVDEELRRNVLAKLKVSGASAKLLLPVDTLVLPDASDRLALFGESLPVGLQLATNAAV